MKFIADLHIHSKFSRATAKNLDLENLYIAAQLKGITVVGTGDFTHPSWFSELTTKLDPAEEGLFKLKDEIAEKCDQKIPLSCRSPVRFILETEISCIYKKDSKTRKNHNLVFMPDFESVSAFNSKLDAIGNIKSDGRPILGLDAKALLEIVLETSAKAFLIPAHIWTPWFSLLGSKSGFDSIEACFEDLTQHIFAVETGLSSDPAMNWRVSNLDHLTLVSNSDAHSPLNLGREANLFNTELSYSKIFSAIQSGDPNRFLGTYEFYPEEGKYHLDGHRKCNICFRPEKSIAHKGICPVCGRPLTLGVLYRVEELADRDGGEKPEKTHPFYSLIPLTEILSEIFQVGPKSKRVSQNYHKALELLGAEFKILHILSIDAIDKAGISLLGEAIDKMRRKKFHIYPGYDGEYGKIKIFEQGERKKLRGQKSLFFIPVSNLNKTKNNSKPRPKKSISNNIKTSAALGCCPQPETEAKIDDIFSDLNTEQLKAVTYGGGPLLIIAGPGTGKTRTITHRMAYLIQEKGIDPKNILAVTFTNKAAQEMRNRLNLFVKSSKSFPLVATFHSLCFKILNDQILKNPKKNNANRISKLTPHNFTIIDESDRKFMIGEAIRSVREDGIRISIQPDVLSDMIVAAKQQILGPGDTLTALVKPSEIEIFSIVYKTYQHLLSIQGLLDYEDLIFKTVKLLEKNESISQKYREDFEFIFVDEYQDLNASQYRMLKTLAPQDKTLCVIGDPDQSIYGFRGSDVRYFKKFLSDYPKAKIINLIRNYRSTETILESSFQVIAQNHTNSSEPRVYSGINGTKTLSIFECLTEKSEAVTIGKTIEQMIGGIGFHSIDFGKIDDAVDIKSRGFSDFAILYRTSRQGQIVADVFDSAGIPYQMVNRKNFLNQKGIQELIAFLKVIEGCGSYADFDRIMRWNATGMVKKTLNNFKMGGYKNGYSLYDAFRQVKFLGIQGIKANSQQMLSDFIDNLYTVEKTIKKFPTEKKLNYIVKHLNLQAEIKNNPRIEEAFNYLIAISRKFGGLSSEFITEIALQTDPDFYESRAEKVALMTMHAAKGLEFPIVFIMGCEKDYIPFRRSTHEKPDIEEERRLFYVAMTRAQEKLYLSYAKKRKLYGKQLNREISPFVNDIEKRLKKYELAFNLKHKPNNHYQLKLF